MSKFLILAIVFTISLGLVSNSEAQLDPLCKWHWRNPLPQGSGLNGVAYGNGIFVAVGSDGILTSTDGVNWIHRTSVAATGSNGVAYGGGTFVVVGNFNLTSTDGVNWTKTTGSGGADIAYGGGTFVAVGMFGKIRTSPDGVNWTTQTSGTTNTLHGVGYGGGKFVAVGNRGTILTSPNGVNWTERSSGTISSLWGVARGGGTFVVVGWDGKILTSPDGVSWELRTLEFCNKWGDDFYAVAYGGGNFVAVGWDGIITSSDGMNWTPICDWGRLEEVGYGGGKFVAVGDYGKILTSPDGIDWTLRTLGPDNDLNGVTYGGGTFVAVDWGQPILTSPDGVNWTPRISGTDNSLFGVGYGGGIFVAVGERGIILTSPDGIDWTPRTSGTADYHLWGGVAYGGGNFVAVGDDGKILTSPDGIDWTLRTSGTPVTLEGVAYGGGNFVVVGDNGGILTSPDGIDWTFLSYGTYGDLCGVTYGGDTFVVVGEYGHILQSDPLNPQPNISVTPTSINFGNVPIGEQSSQTFTICNTGTEDLVIGIITLNGEFSIENDFCSGSTQTPSTCCLFDVVFSPTSEGSKSAELSIPSNDPDTPTWDIQLYGVGVFDKVTILLPNGGSIPSGSPYTISWVAPAEAVTFKLKLSMDNGINWTWIEKEGVEDTSYDWIVPTPWGNKKKCLIKVIGYDVSGGKVGADKSDATFTIEVIKLESPNGGELPFTCGESLPITWTTNGTKRDVAKVKLYYSKNGGRKWKKITTLLGNPGSYDDWTPRCRKRKTKCKVKVVLKDANGKTLGKDVSDGYFTIEP